MGDIVNVNVGENLMEMVKKIEEEFWVPAELLKQLADDMELMMRRGLEDEHSSSIKMLVSYVDSLPSGYFFHFLFSLLLLILSFILHSKDRLDKQIELIINSIFFLLSC